MHVQPPQQFAQQVIHTLLHDPGSLKVEALALVYLSIFSLVYVIGRKINSAVAASWKEHFLNEGGIFSQNFSCIDGSEAEYGQVLVKESPHEYTFNAAGRRFCDGCYGYIELKPRQDLISMGLSLLYPKYDTVTLDVFMKDECMDDFIFAVSKRKYATRLHKDCKDLNEFGSIIDIPIEQRRLWPEEGFCAIAEFKETFGAIFDYGPIPHILADIKSKELCGNLLYIHASDQFPGLTHKKVIRFKFLLPSADGMAKLKPLLSLAFAIVDAVGLYKLGQHAKQKSLKNRSAARERKAKSAEQERLTALREKKAEQKAKERARMTPAQLEKEEEKERQRLMKRRMKFTGSVRK